MHDWTSEQIRVASSFGIKHESIVRCLTCSELAPGPNARGRLEAVAEARRTYRESQELQGLFDSVEEIGNAVYEVINTTRASHCNCSEASRP